MSLIYTSPTSRHNLYLGGKNDAKSLPTLQKRNICRILNVTPAKETGIVAGVPNYFENKSSGKIKYKRISVYDICTSDLLPFADEMVDFISNGLHHGGVLVHCQRGVSRSATAVVMFLMRKINMTMKQSLELCRRRRPVVDPNAAFLDQLGAYERECRTWGHLTAVDNKLENVVSEKKRKKDGSAGDESCISTTVGKRKADNAGCIDGKKKRLVEPGIGPPRGPVGPSRGPVKSSAIGPIMEPTTKVSSGNAKSERGNTGGGKSIGSDRMGKDKKRVLGPLSRPPV